MLAANIGKSDVAFLLLDMVFPVSPAERYIFESSEAPPIRVNSANAYDHVDAQMTRPSMDAETWRRLQGRALTPAPLMQLARRATREHVIQTRGRRALTGCLENLDNGSLPKMLKRYLLMLP